ncbi:G-protein coupled receptor 4-like [Centropristis striata]|uniref:G-protein coupled receptor 4-like n=1 Tax=Centropristis striata TaxID=184440 RepID=UPI0027E04B2F|nr:G-protein coupled receptor 4-like [Centropristis striata]
MDNTSQDNGLNDTTCNNTDYSYKFHFFSLFGDFSVGEVGFIQFVGTCLVICLGLPLTLGAIYGLFSLVRNGEVAPIYVINLLISDLIQFCCMIAEVAGPKNCNVFISEYWMIFQVFIYIYDYSLFASVGFMVCIALERYLVIVHPLWYRCRRTIKTSVLVCVLVWILPVVQFLIERFYYTYSFHIVIYIIFYLLPLPLIIFFLIATLKALYASISVPNAEKGRIAGMLILVLLIYMLLFLPTIIVTVYWYSYFIKTNVDNPHLERLLYLAPMFLKLSPLADLVLYMLLRKGTIRQLSDCLCRCRTDSNEISSVTVNMLQSVYVLIMDVLLNGTKRDQNLVLWTVWTQRGVMGLLHVWTQGPVEPSFIYSGLQVCSSALDCSGHAHSLPEKRKCGLTSTCCTSPLRHIRRWRREVLLLVSSFTGREFQRVGAAVEKALSSLVRCLVLVMGVRRLASEDLRLRVEE